MFSSPKNLTNSPNTPHLPSNSPKHSNSTHPHQFSHNSSNSFTPTSLKYLGNAWSLAISQSGYKDIGGMGESLYSFSIMEPGRLHSKAKKYPNSLLSIKINSFGPKPGTTNQKYSTK